MPRHIRRIAAIVLATAWWVSPAGAQPAPQNAPHEHASSVGQHQGMMGAGHGAGIMTGVHEMFVGHDQLTRSVILLPDGIRTVTESSDPKLAQLIKDHVRVSHAQVATGIDPGLPMESDALRVIFALHDQIRTTVEPTATGVAVTQTSGNSEAVAALQQHAAEVTTLVKEGMAAMHAAMMKKRGL
jgi:hypothetical protein